MPTEIKDNSWQLLIEYHQRTEINRRQSRNWRCICEVACSSKMRPSLAK